MACEEERGISPAIRHFDEALDLEERQARTWKLHLELFGFTHITFYESEFGLLKADSLEKEEKIIQTDAISFVHFRETGVK